VSTDVIIKKIEKNLTTLVKSIEIKKINKNKHAKKKDIRSPDKKIIKGVIIIKNTRNKGKLFFL
jgi:hypothetical protein